MRTREEHLEWCKERARVYLNEGDLLNAVASMTSDMRSHPECGVNDFLVMAAMLHVTNYDEREVRRWIEGFR